MGLRDRVKSRFEKYQNSSNNTGTPSPNPYKNNDIVKKATVTDEVERALNEFNQFQNERVKIALIGQRGAGKSSLINTLRGIGPKEDGAAHTNVNECTDVPTPYSHPEFPHVEYWDLPGVNTDRFPRATYEKDVNLSSYDFFLIVSNLCFKEDDFWLAKRVVASGKRFFLVRSKIDTDIENNRRDHDKTPEETIMAIKTRCAVEASRHNIEFSVYLVSGTLDHADDFDLPRLRLDMVTTAQKAKHDYLVLSFVDYSREFIQKKYEVLQKRVTVYSYLTGTVGMVPVPGVGSGAKVSLLAAVGLEAQKAFGLRKKQLERLGLTKEKFEALCPAELGATFVKSLVTGVFVKVGVELVMEELADTVQSAVCLNLAAPLIAVYRVGTFRKDGNALLDKMKCVADRVYGNADLVRNL